jgi:tetratricopeptide (TPR) repeat protein
MGRIVESFGAILKEEHRLWANVVRATVYVFTAALQLIAIYFSGSRGPWMGLLAGSFFLFILLSLLWRKRWMTIGIIVLALVGGLFLAVLNIPNGPLQSLRTQKGFNRLGELFAAQSRTGQVRVLIWEGAAQLVLPHASLEYPDGKKDILNPFRILIGYGPESMYVAYNPFYPPDLGHVEKRNASPDRSHNETWDSLVFTGLFGLGVYLWVFGTVFYYGLKWLGLVNDRRQRNLFLALFIGGGIVGALVLVLWRGVAYFGVGLPFGIILGMVAYLTLEASFASFQSPQTPAETARALTLTMLLAAIMSHFVEINFGIAIASTRTYFWVFSALMLVVGYLMPLRGSYDEGEEPRQVKEAVKEISGPSSKTSRKRQRRAGRMVGGAAQPIHFGTAWLPQILITAGITALLFVILGYDYISGLGRYKSAITVLTKSVTRLPNKNDAFSYGVLALLLTVWLAWSLVFVAENQKVRTWKDGLAALGTLLGVSGGLAVLYWLWHASQVAQLASQGGGLGLIKGLLTNFYVYGFLLLLLLAWLLPDRWPTRWTSPALLGSLAFPVMLISVFLIVNYTNLRIIHADIVFKTADAFTSGTEWPKATYLYKEAIKLAPDEDYYYLFLGRSYLEQAKLVTDTADQQKLVEEAANDLKRAQKINPLNTDHTANLGRLYNWWATQATTMAERAARGEISSDYFARAVILSPYNAHLWIEWAQVLIDMLGQTQAGFERLTQAIQVDPEYSLSQEMMANFYYSMSRTITDTVTRSGYLDQAVGYYQEAVRVATGGETQQKIESTYALGNIYMDQGKFDLAAVAFEQGIALRPSGSSLYQFEMRAAYAYFQLEDKAMALTHASAALEAATSDDQKSTAQEYINQVLSMPDE